MTRRMLVLGFVLPLFLLCHSTLAQNQEPILQGKPLSEWVKGLENPDRQVRRNAAQVLTAVGRLGKDIVAPLTQALRDKDHVVRARLATALAGIGPDAAAALPSLREALRDPDPQVQVEAAIAIWTVDRQARASFPILESALKNDEEVIRARAVQALGFMGWQAQASLGRILPMLKDEDAHVRANAAIALGNVARGCRGPVPALIAALKDKDRQVRLQAIISLGILGPPARSAVPALRNLVLGADPQESAEAVISLGDIGLDAADATTALMRGLQSKDMLFRQITASALGRIGPPAKAAVPALLKTAQEDSERGVRDAALLTLAAVGPAAREAVPALTELLKGRDVTLRCEAAEALWFIDRSTKNLQVLTAALEHRDDAVRGLAAAILGNFQRHALPAAPALRKALHDEVESVRAAAAGALGRIGAPATADLVEALHDKNALVRAAATRGLGELKTTEQNAISALIEALKDEQPAVRASAAGALAQIGPPAREAAIPLTALAKRDFYGVYLSAIEALGSIEAPAQLVLPIAQETLREDEDVEARVLAANVLAGLKREAGNATLVLDAALRDPSAVVRASAARALWNITGDSKKSVEPLKAILVDAETPEAVREGVALVLGMIGSPAQDALPALREAVKDADGNLAFCAVIALSRLHAYDKTYEPLLIKALQNRVSLRFNPKQRALINETLLELTKTNPALLAPFVGCLQLEQNSQIDLLADQLKKFNPEVWKQIGGR